MIARTSLRLATAVAAASLLAACGSTVPASRQDSAGQGNGLSGATGGQSGTTTGDTSSGSGSTGTGSTGDGSTGTGSTGDGSTGATTGTATDPTTGGTTGASSTTTGSSTGSSSTGSSGTSGTTAPKSPITVGVIAVDYSGIAKQFGVQTADNYFDGYRAVFAYLNKHGGLGGHPIKAVFHTANGAATDLESENEAACAAFTQDAHVQLVFSEIYYQPAFAACLKKHNIAQVDDGQYGLGQTDLQQLANFISPESLTLEREAVAVFQGMTSHGIVTKKSVVGVILGGCDDEVAAYQHALVPQSKKYGFKLVTNELSCYTGFASLAQATSDIQAAVLKFRSQGVDQVLAFTASEGFTLTVFTSQAHSQKYYPGYLITSNGYPYGNTSQGGTASYSQDSLPHMHGVGWGPYFEYGPAAPKATGAQLAAQKLCDAMDPTQGGSKSQSAAQTRYNELQLYYSTCDGILLSAKVISQSGGAFDAKTMRAGFDQLSAGFVGAGPYEGAISLTSAHGDGATKASPFGWSTGCSCMKPLGPPQSIPAS